MTTLSKALKSILCFTLLLISVKTAAQDPPDISLIFYLDEHSENGTLVGTVTATDPDGDPLTFSISSGNDAGAFAISSTSGDITVSDENLLDFDLTPSFALMVEANDGNGGVTTVEVTININDIPLGLGDFSEGIVIYPNPVADVLYVNIEKQRLINSEIVMYSLGGDVIQINPQLMSNSKVQIEVATLEKGIYLLSILNKDEPAVWQRIFVTD